MDTAQHDAGGRRVVAMSGGCLCGRVRYTAAGEPLLTAVCHCKNCQRQAGSAFSVVIAFPASAVEVTGTLKTYDDRGDSGAPVHRSFCPECGSPLFSVVPAAPAMLIVKAGTLDDPSNIRPQVNVWCKSAQPWAWELGALPRFDGNPPLG